MAPKIDRRNYNNCFLDPTITNQCQVMVEILKGHPLFIPLTKTVNVPFEYLDQFWKTIKYIKDSHDLGPHFEFQLDDQTNVYTLQFNLNFLRTTLGFPESNSFPGKEDFDPIPTDKVIFKRIHKLGYDEDLSKVSDFKRKHLSRMWCTIYSILNRCLTPANTGMDGATICILQIFYGIAYHKHIDFAQIVWNQIKKCVKTKKRSYIPFTRFFSIIIRQFLLDNANINRLQDQPIVGMKAFKSIQADTGSATAVPRKIPSSLIALADQEQKDVIEYVTKYSRTEHLNPNAPSRREHRKAGEGPSIKKRKRYERDDGDEGEIAQDDPKNVVGIDGTCRERRSKRVHDNVDKESSRSMKGRKKRMSKRRKHKGKTYGSSGDEAQTSIPHESSPDVPHNQENDQPETQVDENVETAANHPPFNDEYFYYQGYEESARVEVGFESGVENVNVSERSGLDKGQKENDSPPEVTPKRRDATSAIGVHVLHSDVEKAGSSQLPHAHSLPRHSAPSQQGSVLFSHGDEPHTLPTSHLETVGIETRGTPPRPLTFICARKRSLILNTQESGFRDFAHLRDEAGTIVETTLRDVDSRGSIGNPANANIMPTLNAGLMTSTSEEPRYERSGDTASGSYQSNVIEQTGNLSDPVGDFSLYIHPNVQQFVNQLITQSLPISSTTPPPIITPTSFTISSQTSTFIHSQTQQPVQDKGKVIAFDNPIHGPSSSSFTTIKAHSPSFSRQPSSSQTQSKFKSSSMSEINETKQLLQAQLASMPSLSPLDSALLAILTISNNESQSTSPSLLNSLLNRLEGVESRVRHLESSCKVQADSSSRRQDDPDFEDPPEGENR